MEKTRKTLFLRKEENLWKILIKQMEKLDSVKIDINVKFPLLTLVNASKNFVKIFSLLEKFAKMKKNDNKNKSGKLFKLKLFIVLFCDRVGSEFCRKILQ